MNDRTKLLAFCALHALLIVGGTIGLGLRAATVMEAREGTTPTLRNEPLHVGPLHDDPNVVTDEQLRDTLWKLRPRLRGPKPRINHVDHALRFWGIEAMFADPECLSGIEMRELLVDYRKFRSAWGEEQRSMLQWTDNGVRVLVQEGLATSSHVDHTLATLAEVGTPLDYHVQMDEGETTVRAILDDARHRFSLNQQEYEWSTLAFALYAPTGEKWNTTEGQQIDFNTLVHRIVRQDPTYGVCYGNHRVHTLVMLLRIDREQVDILTDETEAFLVDHLKGLTEMLISTQSPEGHWDGNWDGSPLRTGDRTPIERNILVTGHVLEWWSLAPEEVLPPREVITRAGQWMVGTIEELSDSEVKRYYTYLSHAGRALALWRGQFPHEVAIGPR